MIGQVIDGHEIVRPLGTGGMGEVFLARAGDGSSRALKIVRADRATTQSAARFRREVLALGKLKHPGIVRILDAGTASGALYLAMEFVSGPDLQTAVTDGGPLAMGDALRVMLQLASAVAYAHAQGVVHRDLKPSNVLLAGGDPAQAKIIDFGLAKIAADEGLTRLTEDHQVLGSPLYWAPEQSTTAQVGPEADVYALGGIAYYVLSGVPLFRPRPAVALVYAHANETPEPLAVRCRGIELPAGLAELIASCAAKAPAARPRAELLARALDRIVATLPAAASRRSAPRLFTNSDASDLAQALASQIRQVLLDLAALLACPTAEIERLQDEVSERELDLAMLDSEIDANLDAAGDARREPLQETIDDLHHQLAAAFRRLLAALDERRATAPGEAAPLFAELDELLSRYSVS